MTEPTGTESDETSPDVTASDITASGASARPAPDHGHHHAQRSETRAALVQLLLVLAAGLLASVFAGVAKTVAVVLAIVLMIIIHEFGHFITAKWSGMKVEQFFVGFGPRLWSVRRGETEYGVRALPLGGFVKVIGMNNLDEVDAADETRTFRSSPVWRRVVMASAGSFMHFVMAFVISVVLLAVVGIPRTVETRVGEFVAMQQANPAQAAGLQQGDAVLSVNGVAVTTWSEVATQLRGSTAGTPTKLHVKRAGQELDLVVVPVDRRQVVYANGERPVVTDPNVAQGFVGVGPTIENETVSPWTALTKSVTNMSSGSVAVVKAIGQRFSPAGLKEYYDNVTGNIPAEEQAKADENRFVSPVGVVNVADDAAKSGWFAVLSLLFSFNLFIGIFNMIPLLPFDGGHVAVALYEKVRSLGRSRYQADYARLIPVSYAVMLVLVVIAGSSLYLDIFKPLPNQFK